MDFFLFGVTIFALFVSYSIGFLFSSKKSDVPNLPPGTLGLPIVGESLQFLRAGMKGYPEKFFRDRASKYGTKAFKTSILGEPTVVVCGSVGNKFLFSGENKYVQAWWPKSVDKVFPSPDNLKSTEESRRMRKLLPNFLKPEALMRYIGIMDQIAEKHFASDWEGKRQVTVYPLARTFTFWLACKLFVSIDDPDLVRKYAHIFEGLASGILSIPIDLPGTPFNRAVKNSNYIRKELLKIVKQRKIDLAEKRASPTQDILSHMLTTPDESGQYMGDLDIVNKILGLLIGGHDTASAACTFIVKYLAELPHIYEGVRKEQLEIAKSKKSGELLNWDDIQKMKYSWNVACEVMRLAPPLQGSFREALHDFAFDGFTVPKGWKLYWSTHSTHRNPEYFTDPEKFDPSRFDGAGPAPYTYVPFGGGPRMCPGKEYARLEILVFTHHLVKKFRWEKVIPHEKIVVNPMPIPAKGLPIRLYAK